MDDEARAVIGRAYADDPLTRWMFSDDRTRVHACAAWYGLFVEAYRRSGRVTAVDGAVCLWRVSDDPPLTFPSLPTVRGLLDALAGVEHAESVADALHAVAAIAPDHPHVYMNFVAVDPDRQGRGLGADVMGEAFDEARSRGLPVRLETTNPRGRPFLARLGFAPVAAVRLGAGPELVAMERQQPSPAC